MLGLVQVLKGLVAVNDSYLSFMPLYFMHELALCDALFVLGAKIGFATDWQRYLFSAPHHDHSLRDDCQGDILSFAPTFMFGAFVWWVEVQKILLTEIASKSEVVQKDFWTWLERKRVMVEKGLRVGSAIRFIEKKGSIAVIRKALFGNSIKWIGNSCSMMNRQMRCFLGLVLGGEQGIMVEGWNMMDQNTLKALSEVCLFLLLTSRPGLCRS